MKKKGILVLAVIISISVLSGCRRTGEVDEKPVIYLYPEEKTEVSVSLEYAGELTCTYPTYEDGWKVTAETDGTLYDAQGKTYNYLYWEGQQSEKMDFSKGFVIAGKDTAEFLEDSLDKLGLTRKEANEFIVYWLPKMQDNEWNLISFQGESYTNTAKLYVNPTPDTIIRVFMAVKPLDEYQEVEEQTLTTPAREGFTVVEWGGCYIEE